MTSNLHTPVTLRPAVFSDAPAIFQTIKAFPDELVPRSLPNISLNIDRFLVAEAASRIVGTAAWSVLPDLDPHALPSIEIQSVAVLPEYRRARVGRRLVLETIRRVLPLSPDLVIVLTFTPEFFQSLGFVPVSKSSLMYKLYQGCTNCTKHASPFSCPEIAMAFNPRTQRMPE